MHHQHSASIMSGNHHSTSTDPGYNSWANTECVTSAVSSLTFFTSGALLVSSLVFYALSDVMSRKSKLFHHLVAASLAVSSLAYLTQSYGIGVTESLNRCFYFGRYLELILSAPLLLTALGLLAGSSFSEIFLVSSSYMLMFAAQMFGTVLPTKSGSWLMFLFSALMWLPVIRTLGFNYIRDAYEHKDMAPSAMQGSWADKIRTLAFALSGLLLAHQGVQHIMYLLSTVLGKVTGETYVQVMSITDLVSKVLFAITLLSQRDVIDTRARQLRGTSPMSTSGYGSLGSTASEVGSTISSHL